VGFAPSPKKSRFSGAVFEYLLLQHAMHNNWGCGIVITTAKLHTGPSLFYEPNENT